MSASPDRPAPDTLLLALEGISGSGKTHALRGMLSAGKLDQFRVLSEATDATRDGIGSATLTALRSTGNRFFMSGQPRSETALLLALKSYDYYRHVEPWRASGYNVVEDRSLDTIAVYQSAIWNNREPTFDPALLEEVLALSTMFRPLPDLTIVLHADFEVCLQRAEQRNAAVARGPAYSPAERALLKVAEQGYQYLEGQYPERVVGIDTTGLADHEIVGRILGMIERVAA